MNSVQVDSYPLRKTKQLAFQINYIWTALGFALFAGFAIGAHLTFVIGYDFNLGDGFVGLIQTHGHDIAPKKWTQSYAHFLYIFSSYSAGLWYPSVA